LYWRDFAVKEAQKRRNDEKKRKEFLKKLKEKKSNIK